jgi:hypothetical protein
VPDPLPEAPLPVGPVLLAPLAEAGPPRCGAGGAGGMGVPDAAICRTT